MNPSALNSRVLFDLWPFSGWLLTGSCGLTAPNSINNKNPEAIHFDWVISGQHRQLSPPSRILPRSLLVHLTCISLPANHGNSFLLDQFSDPNQTRASTQTFKLGKRIRSNRLLKNKRGQTKKKIESKPSSRIGSTSNYHRNVGLGRKPLEHQGPTTDYWLDPVKQLLTRMTPNETTKSGRMKRCLRLFDYRSVRLTEIWKRMEGVGWREEGERKASRSPSQSKQNEKRKKRRTFWSSQHIDTHQWMMFPDLSKTLKRSWEMDPNRRLFIRFYPLSTAEFSAELTMWNMNFVGQVTGNTSADFLEQRGSVLRASRRRLARDETANSKHSSFSDYLQLKRIIPNMNAGEDIYGYIYLAGWPLWKTRTTPPFLAFRHSYSAPPSPMI